MLHHHSSSLYLSFSETRYINGRATVCGSINGRHFPGISQGYLYTLGQTRRQSWIASSVAHWPSTHLNLLSDTQLYDAISNLSVCSWNIFVILYSLLFMMLEIGLVLILVLMHLRKQKNANMVKSGLICNPGPQNTAFLDIEIYTFYESWINMFLLMYWWDNIWSRYNYLTIWKLRVKENHL